MSFFFFQILTFILIGRPQDVFPALEPLRLALGFTLLTIAATLLENKSIIRNNFFKLTESKKYISFYMVMIISIPFAYYRGGAFNFVFFTYLSNVMFFYLFLTHADSLKRVKQIVFTVSFSILFYGMFSLIKGSFSSGRFSFGTMYDPNDLAYVLVSLLPFSLFFIRHHEGNIKKILGIASVGTSLTVILLTGSRSGLLGLVTVFTLFFFTRSMGITRAVKALLILIVFAVLVSYGSKINTERYLTIADISRDYNVRDEFGRIELWKRGLHMIASHPITGVGVTCFPMIIASQREAEGLPPRWQVAHNSFIQVAAELGLIGFFIFIFMIRNSLKNFRLLNKTEMAFGENRQFKTITKLLQIGFIGSLTISFFLTQAYSILFTLFFAFSAALTKLQAVLAHSSTAALSPEKPYAE